jgi:hypothetical protein
MTPTSQRTTSQDKFHIKTYGNGWAYELTCLTTGAALWFQDQDAAFARSNTDNLTDESAIAILFALLAYDLKGNPCL